MRVLVLGTDVETRNYYIVLSVLDAIRRDPRVEAAFLATHGDALDIMRAQRCDTLFAIGGARSRSTLLERLCATAATSVLWTTEDPYEISNNVDFSAPFGHVFTNDGNSVDDYGGRAQHAALAASRRFQEFPTRLSDADYLYDLCFVGTAWPNRVRTLNKLLASFNGRLRVKLALPHNEHIPKPVMPFANCDLNWRCSSTDFARLANASRITLGLERKFTATKASRWSSSTPPPRVFEAALAGGFQIVLGENPELSKYFDPTTQVVNCVSEDQVVQEITAALADPARRIARAEAARQQVLQHHLYDHRIAAMLDHVLAQPKPAAVPAARPRSRHVLQVTHNISGMRQGGGVEIYQEEIRRIGGDWEVHFLYVATEDGAEFMRLARADGSMRDYAMREPVPLNLLHDAACEGLFGRILIENDIDLVHFQHLLGFPLSLPMIAHAWGVPTIFTMHDYYLICEKYNLIDYTDKFCDTAGRNLATCDICLTATKNHPPHSQSRRRNFVARMIGSIDLLIANTEYSKTYVQKVYPNVAADKIAVVEMLSPANAGPVSETVVAPRRDDRLQVVILGNFTDVKGGHQLIRIMNLMREDEIAFAIVGHVQPGLASILDVLHIPNLTVAGSYRADEVAALLGNFDLSLHLSIWPETFMITLSEAWQAGLVPVVSRLGAPGERVRHGVDGFVVDPTDAGAVVELLRELIADRSGLKAMRAEIATKRLVTPEQHLQRLRTLYDELAASKPVNHATVAFGRSVIASLSVFDIGVRTNSRFWTRDDEIADKQPAIDRPVPPDRTLDALPAGYETLPKIRIDGEAPKDARVCIDASLLDGAPFKAGADAGVKLFASQGWALKAGHGAVRQTFIKLTGDGVTRLVANAMIDRNDVRKALKDPLVKNVGFKFQIPLDTLSGGSYRWSIIQIYEDALVEFENVGRFTVSLHQPELIASAAE